MEFTFTEEQEQFRDIVARFCRDKSPTPTVRKLIETEHGFDEATWRQMCQEVGITGLHLTEDRGGAGFGAVELGIVMEEFGRSLMPAPYFSCAVLACTAIGEIEDSSIRDPLIEPIVSGNKIATLALEARHGGPMTTVENTETRGTWSLNGSCPSVLDAHSADFMLFIVPHGEGGRLFCVETNAAGVSVEPLETVDGTRRQARVTLHDAVARNLGDLSRAATERIYNTALVALANEMAGGAQALLESALEYTKLRVQFGRTIASFQAIKHGLADLLVDVELARTAAYQAAQALASDEEASSTASLAKFTVSETYVKAALECIQLHGGIGFTWENDTHLWYRRAKTSEVFLGSPAFHRERMLKEMGL